MLQNTAGGESGIVGGTRIIAAPTAGYQKGSGRGSTGWSALTEAVKVFGSAAITQEFLKKLLKWQADVGGGSTNCATFKIQEMEAANLRVFVGMVKGYAELKVSHSTLKDNNLFVAQNISGNVICRGYSRYHRKSHGHGPK